MFHFSLRLKLGTLQSSPPTCFLPSSNCIERTKFSPPSYLVASSSTISTAAQDMVQLNYPPMPLPKYANRNGAPPGKMEGVGGNLPVELWLPQGRSDEMHGKNFLPMMILSSMQSSK